jgi:phosphoserine phosphatase
MQEIERLKDRQEICAARQEMASWYRDLSAAEIHASLQNVCLAPGLADGISLLQDHSVTIAIASITWRFAVQHFAQLWGVEHCLATSLGDSGAIDHVWPEHKAQFIRDLSSQLRIPMERTAAVGDSAGDFDMLGNPCSGFSF